MMVDRDGLGMVASDGEPLIHEALSETPRDVPILTAVRDEDVRSGQALSPLFELLPTYRSTKQPIECSGAEHPMARCIDLRIRVVNNRYLNQTCAQMPCKRPSQRGAIGGGR